MEERTEGRRVLRGEKSDNAPVLCLVKNSQCPVSLSKTQCKIFRIEKCSHVCIKHLTEKKKVRGNVGITVWFSTGFSSRDRSNILKMRSIVAKEKRTDTAMHIVLYVLLEMGVGIKHVTSSLIVLVIETNRSLKQQVVLNWLRGTDLEEIGCFEVEYRE